MAEKIKTILITQQDPGSDKNPYVDLAKKHKLKIDYRPFIHVEGLEALDSRDRLTAGAHAVGTFRTRAPRARRRARGRCRASTPRCARARRRRAPAARRAKAPGVPPPAPVK